MTTKTKSSNIREMSMRGTYTNPNSGTTYIDGPHYYSARKETISYETGPMYTNNRRTWKACSHVWNGIKVYENHTQILEAPKYGRHGLRYDYVHRGPPNLTPPPSSLPSVPMPSVQAAYDAWANQLDLNAKNSAQLYSALYELVPMLGMALKCSSVFNRIGRELTRRMRRKPFTEVIKWAIQADFISRFVIQPTIQDARLVANATNFVLNTLSKAHQRTESITPFKASVSTRKESHRTQYKGSLGYVNFSFDQYLLREATRTLFVLAEVKYDIDAVNPVKLWANRVGLTKPLDSMWDLVPFSFVLDYFARTGEFIEHVSNNITSIEGLVGKVARIHDAWQTTKDLRVMRHKGTPSAWCDTSIPPRLVTVQYQTGGIWVDYGRCQFVRQRVSLGDLHRSGFWDSGMFDVQLSTTRKRTIAQLAFQQVTR